MVYQLALVMDEILTPYNEHYALEKKDLTFRKALPTVALLGVSKLVQLEAAEYLYGWNTWRITSVAPIFLRTLPSRYAFWTLWTLRADYFKNMVAVFEQRDIDQEAMRVEMCEMRESFSGASLEERMQEAHFLCGEIMRDSWITKVWALARMRNLASLSIDVGRLTCYAGCCRQETLENLLDSSVMIFGDREEEEEPSLRNRVRAGLELTISGLHGKEEERILRDSTFPATIV